MIPQFSFNILFKHDQENLPGLMAELKDWCAEHQDTEIQFLDLGSHDDSRAIIEKWVQGGHVSSAVKIVDVMDYSHFSQAVGLALRLSVGQVAWVGTPEDFPKTEDLEEIFGLWNDGTEILWGFKPSKSSKFLDPLLRRVEKNYPQSFADQFFEQNRGAFIVCDRKVMITHNALLTSTSHWWRHVVAAGWSMDRWTLQSSAQSATRLNALDVLVLWLNQGAKPLQQLVYTFLGFGACALIAGIAAFALGLSGIEIHPLWNSLYIFGGFAIGVQLLSTAFLFLVMSRRWDRSHTLEKPLNYQENSLAPASPAKLRGHAPLVTARASAEATTRTQPQPAQVRSASVSVTPITKAASYRIANPESTSRPATIIPPEETKATTIAPVEDAEPVAEEVTPAAEPVPVAEPAPAPLAPTQIPIMTINSKSS